MSRKSRQRLREARQRPRRTKSLWLVPAIIIIALASGGIFAWIYLHPKPKGKIAATAPVPTQPRTLNELLALAPADLDKCDIGLMNLLCAEGLPDTTDLDVQECLKKLDGLAIRAKSETDRHYYRFREHPEQFRNSFGYYETMMLEQVLVEDLGIQYNPALAEYLQEGKAPTYGVFSSDSKNLFIHGLLSGSHQGTCASMPVLLVAVGRRLGYPVNLARTKLHVYARYEDYNAKHFNIEPTVTEGFLTPTDNDYKTGQFAATDDEIKDYGWLRPCSNREILSEFLANRGNRLAMAKRYEQARDMAVKSASYAPDTPLRRKALQLELDELKNAPLGDKIDDWRDEIARWDVPQGESGVYINNRKIQIRYFVGLCPDADASQKAVDDLKSELVEYQRQLVQTNPAPVFRDPSPQIFDLVNKAGQELRLPSETLPPPLNRNTTPKDYLNCIAKMNLDDGGAVMDALWRHYRDVTSDWSNQPALLLPESISALTAH